MKCIKCGQPANSTGQLCSRCYAQGKGETILTETEKKAQKEKEAPKNDG